MSCAGTLNVDGVMQDVREIDGSGPAGQHRGVAQAVSSDGLVRQRWSVAPGSVQPGRGAAGVFHHDFAVVPGEDRIVALGRAALPSRHRRPRRPRSPRRGSSPTT
ncbi:MAG: hypothetical protein R3F59_09825 [Myxococcota bacterium]